MHKFVHKFERINEADSYSILLRCHDGRLYARLQTYHRVYIFFNVTIIRPTFVPKKKNTLRWFSMCLTIDDPMSLASFLAYFLTPFYSVLVL